MGYSKAEDKKWLFDMIQNKIPSHMLDLKAKLMHLSEMAETEPLTMSIVEDWINCIYKVSPGFDNNIMTPTDINMTFADADPGSQNCDLYTRKLLIMDLFTAIRNSKTLSLYQVLNNPAVYINLSPSGIFLPSDPEDLWTWTNHAAIDTTAFQSTLTDAGYLPNLILEELEEQIMMKLDCPNQVIGADSYITEQDLVQYRVAHPDYENRVSEIYRRVKANLKWVLEHGVPNQLDFNFSIPRILGQLSVSSVRQHSPGLWFFALMIQPLSYDEIVSRFDDVIKNIAHTYIVGQRHDFLVYRSTDDIPASPQPIPDLRWSAAFRFLMSQVNTPWYQGHMDEDLVAGFCECLDYATESLVINDSVNPDSFKFSAHSPLYPTLIQMLHTVSEFGARNSISHRLALSMRNLMDNTGALWGKGFIIENSPIQVASGWKHRMGLHLNDCIAPEIRMYVMLEPDQNITHHSNICFSCEDIWKYFHFRFRDQILPDSIHTIALQGDTLWTATLPTRDIVAFGLSQLGVPENPLLKFLDNILSIGQFPLCIPSPVHN